MILWLGPLLVVVGAFLLFDLLGLRERLVAWNSKVRQSQAERSPILARIFMPADPQDDRDIIQLTYQAIGGAALAIGLILTYLGWLG